MKRSRLSIVVMWTLACVGFVAASATALSAPGEGIKVGNATVTPYLVLQAISDSNVQVAKDNEQDDVSVTEKLGLDVTSVSDTLTLMGRIWGLAEQYSDLSDEDHEDFGESINVKYGKLTALRLILQQSYQNVDQLDYATGSIEQRENNNLKVGAARDLTDKLQGDISYAFKATDYESPHSYDWDENRASLEISHALTDKTAARVVGSVGTLSSDANDDDADFTVVQLGLKTRRTQKLIGKVGVGYRDHDIGDDNISGVSFQAGAFWQAAPDITVEITADNGVQPASQNPQNYTVVTRGFAKVNWQLSDTVVASLSGMYRGDEYENDVLADGVLTKKDSDVYTGKLRLTYLPPARFMEIYVEGSVEDKSASISANEYSQTMATAGLKLKY